MRMYSTPSRSRLRKKLRIVHGLRVAQALAESPAPTEALGGRQVDPDGPDEVERLVVRLLGRSARPTWGSLLLDHGLAPTLSPGEPRSLEPCATPLRRRE